MIGNREKRSSSAEITDGGGQFSGVGGRQGEAGTPPARGGYLDICTSERLADPRLAELADCGLADHWLRVAAEIGVDKWLVTWRILSEERSVQDDCGRVHVPSISTYMRYQRNRLIASLCRQGHEAEEVQSVLRDQLGYDLTLRYVRQLMRAANE